VHPRARRARAPHRAHALLALQPRAERVDRARGGTGDHALGGDDRRTGHASGQPGLGGQRHGRATARRAQPLLGEREAHVLG
jgi:hypothetical protein